MFENERGTVNSFAVLYDRINKLNDEVKLLRYGLYGTLTLVVVLEAVQVCLKGFYG